MLGFTKNEERVVFILIGTFIIGSAIRLYQSRFAPLPKPVVKAQWIPAMETDLEQTYEEKDLAGKGNPEDNHRIDLNRATHEELISISGIGPVLADRIVQYRESNNGFTSIDELKNVHGIGKKKLEQIQLKFIIH